MKFYTAYKGMWKISMNKYGAILGHNIKSKGQGIKNAYNRVHFYEKEREIRLHISIGLFSLKTKHRKDKAKIIFYSRQIREEYRQQG